MHIVSGLSYSYEPMAAAMDGEHPVYGVISGPMRGGDAVPRTIEAMARRYADDIVTAYPDGPYRVAGYSWAGRLALTTAAELEERGHTVDLVAILDSWHPDDEPERAYERMVDNAPDSRATRGAIRSLVVRVPRIPRRIWYHAVVAWCRLNRLPLPAWAASRLQTRIGMKALKTDHSRFPLCDILYFRATGDSGATSDDRWRMWATDARATIIDIEGTHRGEDSIVSPQRVGALAAKLDAELSRRDNAT
jgi:thioesterase domain-containing protein